MLQVSVVDSSAEERLKTVNWLQEILESGTDGIEFVPRLTFRPVSVSELKFKSAPDLIVIGPGLAMSAADELVHIRKTVPEVPLILFAPEQQLSLATVEYLARTGIEEILPRDIKAPDLLRRLIMISSRIKRKSAGQLIIVDSAKGGVGASTVVAALGELLAESGKRVLLLDTDDERQSLSRFLQARPFINEAFQGLITGARPVTTDLVEACVGQVWKDLPGLWCMSPAATGILEGPLTAQTCRILIAILETLEPLFDCIIVDATSARGTYRRVLQRAADRALLVCDADPASAFASCERLRKMREEISLDASIHVIQNQRTSLKGISSHLLRKEFERAGRIRPQDWCISVIPFCADMARWPGSGMAAYLAASRRTKRRLLSVAQEVGLYGITGELAQRQENVLRQMTVKVWCWFRNIPFCRNAGFIPRSPRLEHNSTQLPWIDQTHGEELVDNLISPPRPMQI